MDCDLLVLRQSLTMDGGHCYTSTSLERWAVTTDHDPRPARSDGEGDCATLGDSLGLNFDLLTVELGV
jgi:hypothetical protein